LNGVEKEFAYLGMTIFGISFLNFFISIFGYNQATYWGGYFQMILYFLIIYDYSDIRLTKP